MQAIRTYGMFSEGSCVTVGLSGGADSVALLHFLSSLRQPWQLRLSAVHVNHHLRGEESSRDEAFVRTLCARWGVPLTVVALDIARLAAQERQSVELCAREQRYRIFAEVAGGGHIATAHTQNDNAETVLFHLVRGTALRGLGGIPPVRGNIIRPLILTPRRAVEDYCRAHGLEYVTDSSNHSDSYTRNRLRHTVLPLLEQENPAFLHAVSGMADSLRKDADYLDGLAAEALAGLCEGLHRYHCGKLQALPEPLRLRVLRDLCVQHQIPVERRRLQQLDALLTGGGQVRLSGQWYGRCSGDILTFLPAQNEAERFTPVVLHPPFSPAVYRVFPDKTLRLTVFSAKNFRESQKNRKNQFKNALDCDKIDKITVVRQRLPGDRIRLAGRGCTKTLRKLFQETGLPPEQRNRILLLASGEHVLWLEGFGVDETVQVDGSTRQVLCVEVEP